MNKTKTVKTIRTKVYRFEALTEQAKKKALDHERQTHWNGIGYAWENESWDTFRKFSDLFDEWTSARHAITMDRDEPVINIAGAYRHLEGKRLVSWIWNNLGKQLWKPKYLSIGSVGGKGYKSRYSNCQIEVSCPLTGYCMDMDILSPIVEYMTNPKLWYMDLQSLLYQCVQEFLRALEKEKEWQDSDEFLKEEFAALDAWFYDDGTRHF